MAMTNSGMNTSSALWRKDRTHFLHPWTHFDTFKRDGSLVIQNARGAYVWDASGKRYLDGIGGLWCVNIGYGREEMAQAIADQDFPGFVSHEFLPVRDPLESLRQAVEICGV